VTEIRGELLGTLVVASLDSLASTVSGYLQAGVPAPFQPMVQPEALKALLSKELRLDSLVAALDSSRPAVLGLADPVAYRQGALGALVLALPLKDGRAFIEVLEHMALRHETTPWRDHVLDLDGKLLLARLERDWVLLSSHEKLLNGAAGALLPLASKSAPGRLQLSVDMLGVQARFGAQIDRAVDAMAVLLNEPRLASMQATLRRWVGYLKGMRGLDLRLELQPAELRAQLAAHSLGQGEFRKFLDALPVGEPWGARFVPADAVVLILDRTRPESRLELLDESLQTIKASLGDAFDEASLKRLREALAASSRQFGGEAATGFWVNGDGGIGAGGAMAVKDAAAAQKQLARLVQLAGKELARLMEKGLDKGAPSALKGFRLSIGVRPRALPVGGLKADLYELAIRWPRPPRDPVARRKIEETRRAIAKLLGPRPSLAFVATGELGLVAFGKDFKKRLTELVAIARGGPGSAQARRASELCAGRRPALLVHMPLTSVVEGALRAIDQVTPVPQRVRELVTQQVLPGPGKDIPVTALMHKDGTSLYWELQISADLVATLARVVFYFRGAAAAP
jgi:hypothetical protein